MTTLFYSFFSSVARFVSLIFPFTPLPTLLSPPLSSQPVKLFRFSGPSFPHRLRSPVNIDGVLLRELAPSRPVQSCLILACASVGAFVCFLFFSFLRFVQFRRRKLLDRAPLLSNPIKNACLPRSQFSQNDGLHDIIRILFVPRVNTFHVKSGRFYRLFYQVITLLDDKKR